MVDQDCWNILYAPDLGPLRKETKELKSQKGGLNIACQEKAIDVEMPKTKQVLEKVLKF